jgi:hypothetical protein
MTSNSKVEGRFGKQDFRCMAEEDAFDTTKTRTERRRSWRSSWSHFRQF